jgi:hypothetical protein
MSTVEPHISSNIVYCKKVDRNGPEKGKEVTDPRLGLGPKPCVPDGFYYFKLERKYLEATRPY